MIDIIPIIASVINDIAPVELVWPDVAARFPLITISEVANIADTVIDNTDILADITVQIDAWDKADNPANVIALAGKVNAAVGALGFRRLSAQLMPATDGIQRKTMRYRGIVDEINGRVYTR